MGCCASVTAPPPEWVGVWSGGDVSNFLALQISENGRGGYMRVTGTSRVKCGPGW